LTVEQTVGTLYELGKLLLTYYSYNCILIMFFSVVIGRYTRFWLLQNIYLFRLL